MRVLLRIILLSASICWAASGGHVTAGYNNLILNSDFSTGYTDWSISTLNASQEATTTNTSMFTNPPAATTALVQSFSDSGSITLSQSIATVAGEQYDIIFYATSTISEQIAAPPETVQVSFGSSTFAAANVPLSGTSYTEFVYEGIANSSISTLQLTFGFNGKDGIESIYTTSVFVAVPEPASVTMTGMACLMGLACAWRRRRLTASAVQEFI